MSRLKWLTNHKLVVGSCELSCDDRLYKENTNNTLLRHNSKIIQLLKTVCWPIVSIQKNLLIDGFIYRKIAVWATDIINNDTVFLEVGCGNMEFKKFLPKHICYNAFDISLSTFHLGRIRQADRNTNIALASATNIPLKSSSVNLIVSCEVFEHVPNLEQAVSEIHRVAMPSAKLLCSIPNNYGYKYRQKGAHPDHINNFTFQEFVEFMESRGFILNKSTMKGWWIPFPKWLTKTSYQLPFSHRDEFYCTNFIYQFEVKK